MLPDNLVVTSNDDNHIVDKDALMAESNADTGYEIIWLVRHLFRSLADTANNYLKDDELTAADRAVM